VKKTSAALMAVPLAASMLLAACGGDAKPGASSSSTSTSSPTTTAPPTASTTTDPNIPLAARAHTPAGAEAFVRYFFDQLNETWQSPKTGQIARLSLPACKTCQQYESAAAGMVSKNQRYEGEAFSVTSIASLGEAEVLIVGAQEPGKIIASDGSIVETKSDTDKAKFIASLDWSTPGWRVAEIQVAK